MQKYVSTTRLIVLCMALTGWSWSILRHSWLANPSFGNSIVHKSTEIHTQHHYINKQINQISHSIIDRSINHISVYPNGIWRFTNFKNKHFPLIYNGKALKAQELIWAAHNYSCPHMVLLNWIIIPPSKLSVLSFQTDFYVTTYLELFVSLFAIQQQW